jgi:hypothetical protein
MGRKHNGSATTQALSDEREAGCRPRKGEEEGRAKEQVKQAGARVELTMHRSDKASQKQFNLSCAW